MDVRKDSVKPGGLVPQPHGGALRHGSLPGTNSGGPGRPPSEIRKRLRGTFEERAAVIEEILASEEATNADKLRAVDLLLKYGLGAMKELSVDNVRDKLVETIQVIHQELSEEEAERVLLQLKDVWR